MIYYLKRNQLDDNKYNSCIKQSKNSRIYAFSWYLDCVADNWDALVLNDYEAVMPLPWRQKYFIKYIYPPAWTQQLGVFSPNEVSEKLVLDFIKAIPRKFKKITIQFNAENDVSLLKTQNRVNYILKLNKTYDVVFKGFRKDRKDRLKQVKRKNYILRDIKIEDLIDVGKRVYSYLNISDNNYAKLKLLSDSAEIINKGFLLGVYSNNDEFLGGTFFLKDKSRITYLFSVATEIGKKEQVITQIINEVIDKYSNNNFILDFEGSMIEGIASFYESFGGNKELYATLLKTNI